MIRYKCKGCNAVLDINQVLEAKNPFCSDDIIRGCPQCFDIENFQAMCYDSDCMNTATSGFTKGDEYVFACSHHYKVRNDT